ncbi:MAG: DUF983 domain-containing protein [Candidatus Lambdaproteobacteria bacterium]|nr:DUF983 domain-containing protein [Candidatus Lambdaproteobacteria bacterium]
MNLSRFLLRSFSFRCPHCGVGRLTHRLYGFNHHCEHCGYAYLPDDGDFWGGVVICYALAGIIGIGAGGLLVSFADVSVQALIYAATLTTVAAVLALFPLSKSVYTYLLYYTRGHEEEYRPPADFHPGK